MSTPPTEDELVATLGPVLDLGRRLDLTALTLGRPHGTDPVVVAACWSRNANPVMESTVLATLDLAPDRFEGYGGMLCDPVRGMPGLSAAIGAFDAAGGGVLARAFAGRDDVGYEAVRRTFEQVRDRRRWPVGVAMRVGWRRGRGCYLASLAVEFQLPSLSAHERLDLCALALPTPLAAYEDRLRLWAATH